MEYRSLRPAVALRPPISDSAMDDKTQDPQIQKPQRPVRKVRFRSLVDIFSGESGPEITRVQDRSKGLSREAETEVSSAKNMSTIVSLSTKQKSDLPVSRFLVNTAAFCLLLMILRWSPLVSNRLINVGAEGGPVQPQDIVNSQKFEIETRQSSDPTDYCKRWSHQSAMVNGTIYIFGGRKTTSAGQTTNQWNNEFMALDATKTWQISSPPLEALPQPSGPPAVANGFLWHSFDHLFLYGGEYSDTPTASPSPYALWTYDIASKSWTESSNPETSQGNNSGAGNQPVLGVAEGAGVSVPSLGRGYYFGGHQDFLSTAGWSYYTTRVYLKSLLEYTFPGYTNNGIADLVNTAAPSAGAWRNITTGAIQSQAGFSERADGLLVYVPGFGAQGIILGIGGGNNNSFPEMNIIDVYDIATSEWYQQATTGAYPQIRVNPCAVAAAAPDGSSTNVYMFGGQNLQPAGQQTQYNDMWILSVPSFDWIQVNTSSQSTPPGRAGHTCEIWDGQMIVIGGYIGQLISCEQPGIFVFDLSRLSWVNQFSSLSGSNAEDQQPNQVNDPNALSGSYGYSIPDAVQAVIGGSSLGGATATAPLAGASGGPLATGAPVTYTVTGAGSITTQTTTPGGTSSSSSSSGTSSGPNVAAIVAGTIAGVLFLLVCYLGFCTFIYRKQLKLYKNHVAAAQRAAAAAPYEKHGLLPALAAAAHGRDGSSSRRSGDRSSFAASVRQSGRFGNGRQDNIPPVPRLDPNITKRSDTSEEDLLLSYEPTFVGVLLNPRRSLRVINRD